MVAWYHPMDEEDEDEEDNTPATRRNAKRQGEEANPEQAVAAAVEAGEDSDDQSDAGSDLDATTKLTLRKFKIHLDCRGSEQKKQATNERYSKHLKAVAQVCTSVISLSRTLLDFGDCNIGTKSVETVAIKNLSELPTEVP